MKKLTKLQVNIKIYRIIKIILKDITILKYYILIYYINYIINIKIILKDMIIKLKTKYSNNHKDYNQKNQVLKKDKELIQSHFQELKRKLNKYRENEKERLITLTTMSNKTIKNLKEKVNMAEKILRLSEMNRKLEMEEEKINPFQNSNFEIDPSIEIEMEEYKNQLKNETKAALDNENNELFDIDEEDNPKVNFKNL